MKRFHDFNPLSPFTSSDVLQIQNRRVRLSHVPLKNSVSIRGFLPADILSDVKSNTYWVDYRDNDGYRSANGEIFFDPSREGEFVDVSYLGIGTVLRATDMNEVADSINHLGESIVELSNLISNNTIRISVVSDEVDKLLNNHNKNTISHKDIRESITAINDSLNYQLGTVSLQTEGLKNLVKSTADNLQKEIELASQGTSSIVSAANHYTDEQIQHVNMKLDDINNQFIGVINTIDDGDAYVERKIEALSDKIENDLNTERRSAITARNNLKREIYERTANDVQKQLDDYDLSVANRLNNFDLLFKNSLNSINDRISGVSSNLDEYYAHTTAIIADFDDKFDDINVEIDSTNAKLSALSTTTYDTLDALTTGYADLAQTVYQARQAVNRQLDSMSTDVALANQNLKYSRDLFDKKITYIEQVQSSIESSFDELTNAYEDELDSMSGNMQEFFDRLIDSFNNQYNSMISGAESAQTQFNVAYQSLDAAIDRFSDIEANIQSSIDAAVNQIDLSAVESSIQRAYDYTWIITNPINQSLDDIAYSLENMNVDLSPVETSIQAVLDTLENIDFDVDFTPVENSIKAVQNDIANTKSTLTSYGTRISNLENKQGVMVLSTTPSNTDGGMWYVV